MPGVMYNPGFRSTRPVQGALYYARQRRRANAIMQGLTPWSHSLVVQAGDYVTSENGNSPWIALGAGTTGVTAPSGQGVVSDGVVSWRRVDIMSLLRFLYVGAPTP